MPEYLSSILSDFSYVEFNRYNQPWLIAGSTFMHDPSYHAEYTQKYMTIFSASGDIKIVNQNLQDKLEISSNNVVMLNNVDICNNLTVSNKIDASNIVLYDLSSTLATINYSTITSLDVSLVQSIDNRIDVSAQLVYLNKNLTVVDTIDASQVVLRDLSTNLATIQRLIVNQIQNSNEASGDIGSLSIEDDGKVTFNKDVSFNQNVTVKKTLNVGILNIVADEITGKIGTLDIGDVLLDISSNLRGGYFPEAVIGYDVDDTPDACIKAIITSLSGENVEISNNVFVKNRIDASFIEISGIRILDPSQFSIGSESGGSTSNIINFPTGLKIDKDISATNIEASNNLFVKNNIDASFIDISGIRIRDPAQFRIGSDSGGSTSNIINFPTGLKIDKDISATNIEASNNLFVKNIIDASFIDVSGIRIRDPAQFSIGTSEGGSTSNKIAFPTSMSVGGDLEITGDLIVDGEKMVNPRVQFALSNTSKLQLETFKHTDTTQKFYSYYDGSSNTHDLSLDNTGFRAGLNVLFEEYTQTINLLSGEIYSVLPDFSGAIISRPNDSIYKVEDNKIIIANPTLDNEKERYRVNVSSNFNFSTSNKNSTKLEVALLKHDTSKNTIEIIERASSTAISKSQQDSNIGTDSSNIETQITNYSFDRYEDTSRDISNLTVFYHPLQDKLYLFEISNNRLVNTSYSANNQTPNLQITNIGASKISAINYIDGTSNYTSPTSTIYKSTIYNLTKNIYQSHVNWNTGPVPDSNKPEWTEIITNLNYNYFPPRAIDATEWTTREYTTSFPLDNASNSYNHGIFEATTTINSLQYTFRVPNKNEAGNYIIFEDNNDHILDIFSDDTTNYRGYVTGNSINTYHWNDGVFAGSDYATHSQQYRHDHAGPSRRLYTFGKTLPNDINLTGGSNNLSYGDSEMTLASGPYIQMEFPYPVAMDYFEQWQRFVYGSAFHNIVIIGSNFIGDYGTKSAADSNVEILYYLSNSDLTINPNYVAVNNFPQDGMIGTVYYHRDYTINFDTGRYFSIRGFDGSPLYVPDASSVLPNMGVLFPNKWNVRTNSAGHEIRDGGSQISKLYPVTYTNFNPELKFFKQYTIQFCGKRQHGNTYGSFGGNEDNYNNTGIGNFSLNHINFRYVEPTFGIPRSNGLTIMYINDLSLNNYNKKIDGFIDFSDNNLSQSGGFIETNLTGDLDNVVYSYKYNVIATLSQSSTTIRFINNRYDSTSGVYNQYVDLSVNLSVYLDKLYNILAIDNRDIFLVIGKKDGEDFYRLLILNYSLDNSGNVTQINYFDDYGIKIGQDGITFANTDLIKILYISERDTIIIYKENTNEIYYNNIDTIISYIINNDIYINFSKVDTNILDGSINHIYWFHELDILIIDKINGTSHIYDIARIQNQEINIISSNNNWKYNLNQAPTNATRKTNNIIYSPNTGKLFRVDISGEIIQTNDLREYAVKTSIVNILDSTSTTTTTRKTLQIPGTTNRLELGWVSTVDTFKNHLWTVSIPYDINIYKVYDGPKKNETLFDHYSNTSIYATTSIVRDQWLDINRTIEGNQRDNIITMNAPVTGNMIKRLTGWSIKCYDLSDNDELLDKIIVSNDTYLKRETTISNYNIRDKLLQKLHTSTARQGVHKTTDHIIEAYSLIGENRFCNWDIIDFWSFSYLGIKYIKSKRVLLLYGAIKDISQVRVPNTTSTNQVINYSDMSLVDFDCSGDWCHSLMSIELDDNNDLNYNILDTYSLYRDGNTISTIDTSYVYTTVNDPELEEILDGPTSTQRTGSEIGKGEDAENNMRTQKGFHYYNNGVADVNRLSYPDWTNITGDRLYTANNNHSTSTCFPIYRASIRKTENIQLCEYIDDKDLLVVIGHEWESRGKGFVLNPGSIYGPDRFMAFPNLMYKKINHIFIKTYYEITKNGFTSYIKQTFNINSHLSNTAEILDFNITRNLANQNGNIWAGGFNIQTPDAGFFNSNYDTCRPKENRTYSNMQYYRKGVYNYRSLPCSSCFCSGWFNSGSFNGCLLLLHDDGIIRTFKLENVTGGGLENTMWTEDTTNENITILYTYLKQVSGIIDLSSRVIKCEYLGEDINEVVVIGERNLRLASLSLNSSNKIKLSINTSLTSYQQASALLRLSNQSLFSNHFAEDISNVLSGYSNTSYGVVQNSFGNSLWIEDLSLLLLAEFDGVYYDLSGISGVDQTGVYEVDSFTDIDDNGYEGFDAITDFANTNNTNNKQKTKLIAYNVNSDGNLHRNSANRLIADLNETIGGIEYNSETRELIILTRTNIIHKPIIEIVNTITGGPIADPETLLNINFNKDVILGLSNELLIGYLLRNQYSLNTSGLNREQTEPETDSDFKYTIERQNFKFNLENYAQANFTSIKADQVDFSGIPILDTQEYTNLKTGFLYQTQDGTIKIKKS